MNHASLFSGIGGFDLAAEWMGWTNIFNCDIEEFPRKVLKYHFPNAKQYADIKQTDFTIHRGQVDILTGGFPCQPFSMAGKRLGKNDERHLWPEMLRAIREIKPKWIVGENVRGLLGWNDGLVFDEVQTDLEVEGYEVQSFILPAAGINAPHKRDRVWIIASDTTNDRPGRGYSFWGEERWDRMVQGEQEGSAMGSEAQRRSGELSSNGDASNSDNAGLKAQRIQKSKLGKKSKRKAFGRNRNEPLRGTERWESFPTQSPVCGGDDGIPRELDAITFSKWRRESIKGYGNAIVPQIAYRIFQAIEYVELDTNLRTIL